MKPNPALSLYERIEAASRLQDLPSQIRDIRVILETLFNLLTREENRSFSNLYGRMEYIFDKMEVRSLMREQLHGLRIFSNKVAHNDMQLTPVNGMTCIRAIAEGVEYFYETKVPADLLEIYRPLGDRRFTQPKSREVELIDSLQAIVVKASPVEQTENGGSYFVVQCREESLGEFDLQLWRSNYNDLTTLQPWLQPYDTIQLLNCRKHPSRPNAYTSVGQTQVVLEPDILIDISELAECFQRTKAYPVLALLNKLVPQDYSQKAFQGNMVNAMLDAAIREEELDFMQAFKDAVAENVFQAAIYGKKVLNEIFKEIKANHWPALSKVATQYRSKPTRLEPTFFSARYGLQGRLDLLVENASDPLVKEIVELKSGKAPDNNAWINHEMQVVGYNLLLKSTYGANRKGSSAVLYSASQANPIRNIVSNELNENRLIQVRNELVYYYLQHAQGNMSVLEVISPARYPELPSFKLDDLNKFHSLYTHAGALEKTYYHHFLCFIFRQWLHEKCGMYAHPERQEDGDGFAALWRQSEAEKQQNFSLISDLNFQRFDADEAVVVFTMGKDQQHNFRPGDTAILYRRLAQEPAPLHQQIIKGRVDHVGGGELVFSLNNKQLNGSYFEQSGASWLVEHDIFEKNNWVASQALLTVLDPAYAERFRLLMGLQAPRTGDLAKAEALFSNQVLEPAQRQLLTKALAAEDYCLVQGPPGTGKTSTLLPQLVNGLLQQEGSGSILVVAFTNRAVEEIATRLEQKGIAFMRLGGRGSKADQDLRKLCTDGKIEEAREYILKHRVYLATVTTMSNRIHTLQQLKGDLDILIVDEASQLTEPQLLSLIMDRKKFILIGDQNQLPPVVAIHEAFCQVADADLQAAGLADLRTALFERLYRKARQEQWHDAIDMLRRHYRMHEEIAGLINPWYGNQLEAARPEQKAPWDQGTALIDDSEDRWHEVLQRGRVIYLPSQREPVSKYHQQEARRVVSLLRYLRKKFGSAFTKDTVGVVTPWRTQIGLIRNLIGKDEDLQQLNIDTIERFQGSENDIIIVSMAVYHPSQVHLLTSAGKYPHINDRGELEEIEVDRKLLVTLSRAKEQVVVMGYEPALKFSNQYIRVLNNYLK